MLCKSQTSAGGGLKGFDLLFSGVNAVCQEHTSQLVSPALPTQLELVWLVWHRLRAGHVLGLLELHCPGSSDLLQL